VDNLCHTLVGAALAEAGLKRRSPRAYATLLIGANLPDLDAVAMLTGNALGFRRGATHGLPALVLLPLVLSGLIVLWDRWRPGRDGPVVPTRLLGVAAVAIATHPFLDWLNTYGMRWLMPLDGRWFYGDTLFIVDPWLWLMLGGGVLLARLRRRVGAARMALAFSVAYIAGMLGLTEIGRGVAARDLGLESPGPRTLMVGPLFLHAYRREVLVDAGDRYRFGEIEWLPVPRLRMTGREQMKSEAGLQLGDLELDRPARAFLDWARFPYLAHQGDRVRIDDARYARGGPSWAGIVVRRRQRSALAAPPRPVPGSP
jgi:inner membrane protein